MYRSVSALIFCGTVAIAAAPSLAIAKDATCIRTSHGVVVCGQMVEHGRAALPKQHYESRSAAAKHGAIVHDRSYQTAHRGHAPQYAERGRTYKDEQRDFKRAGTAHSKVAYTVAEPARRAGSHDVVYEDRPHQVAKREIHRDSFYADRNGKPIKQAYSRSGYAEPRLQQAKWDHASKQAKKDRAYHAVNSERSRAVAHSERDDRQAKGGHAQQDVDSDERGHEVHQDGSRQADGRDHRDQDDQDQKD